MRGSTPVLPSAFLNDHASDDDSSLVLPLSAAENRTISNASIVEENYFFEWCVWIGHAVYGLAYWPYGAIAVGAQAVIVMSIWKVTGIPATEEQALRSKGDAYRDYQRRVSAFVPWLPRD